MTYNSPKQFQEFVIDNGGHVPGSATANGIPLTVGWLRDTRDSALVPTKGRMQKANLEISPVLDMQYYRASYQHQYYIPVGLTGSTFMLNGQIDYGDGLGGKKYPVFKNFYAGGIGTVRGYESASLGRVEYGHWGREYLGGSKRIVANVEMQLPFPGTDYDRTLRWFVFTDAGNVWAEDQTIKLNDLRYSAGFGITWVSPLGPLKLSMGFPLNAKPTDRKERFQFTLGTGF